MAIETSFPRNKIKQKNRRPAFNLFSGKKKLNKKLKAKQNKNFKDKRYKGRDQQNEENDQTEIFGTTHAERLNFKTIQEGMVILGRIRSIQRMCLNISLPGRIPGKVPITCISLPYTSLLQNIVQNEGNEKYLSLKQLYKPGQYVLCKVIQIKKDLTQELYDIVLSLCPQDVQSDFKINQLRKGLSLVAAVSSIEDHVYVMDSGINNCRCFLPKKNTEDENLALGQLIWCKISKCTVNDGVATATLTANSKEVSTYVENVTTIRDLLPSMKVELTINKILPDGLEVTFLNNYIGYINETYLAKVFDKPKSYEVNGKITGYVLYIMPTTNLTYFTLKNIETMEDVGLSEGSITNSQIVSQYGKKGLLLKLAKKYRGYVSYKRLGTKKIPDENILLKKQFEKGKSHKCRIINYEYMDQMYNCTFEKELIDEKYFCLNDAKPGELVSVNITKITPSGVEVQFGRLTGFIYNMQLADIPLTSTALAKKFHIGQKINARVLYFEDTANRVYLTAKPCLVNNSLPILSSYVDIKRNSFHEGVIVLVKPEKGLLVRFFGDVRGWVPLSETDFPTDNKLEDIYFVGHVIKCRILKYFPKTKKLSLSLKTTSMNQKDKKSSIGDIVSNLKITNIRSTGIEMMSENQNFNSFVPAMCLTEHASLAQLHLGLYNLEETITSEFVCIEQNIEKSSIILSKRDVEYFQNGVPSFEKLKKDDILRCSFDKINNANEIILKSPIQNFHGKIIVASKKFNDDSSIKLKDLELKQNQLIFAKINYINKKTHEISVTTQLNEVWDDNLNVGAKILASYLKEIETIRKVWRKNKHQIAKIKIGEKIQGKISSITDSGMIVLQLPNGLNGVVPKDHIIKKNNIKLDVGTEVTGTVIWVDFPLNCVFISLLSKLTFNMKQQQKNVPIIEKGKFLRAKITLIRPDFVMAQLKGQIGNSNLVFLPSRLHHNDFTPDLSEYNLSEIVKVSIVRRVKKCCYVGILKSKIRKQTKLQKYLNRLEMKKRIEKRVAKKEKLGQTIIANSDDDENLKKGKRNAETLKKEKRNVEILKTSDKLKNKKRKQDVLIVNDDLSETKTKKVKLQKVDDAKKDKISNELSKEVEPVLPGMDIFWSLNLNNIKDVVQENNFISDEENDEEKEQNNDKNKKLSAKEKVELSRKTEEKYRQIEERLADPNIIPETAEEFDRLVLTKPDNSVIWINYMAFHLQSTEIEKARAIAKRALQTISFREEEDRFNVWVALMNLENRYGTNESFNTCVQEAAKTNHDLKIYIKALHILADAGKINEFDEFLNKVLKRHKHLTDIWLQGASACFLLNLHEKARHLLQRGLTSLDKKLHIDFINQFAQLEYKNGNTERAETLYEQILNSYPRRVDIWCCYVDMLVKANRIEIARKVLERSITLKLPARKMKTLFKKFIEFEKAHGDEISVNNVKELAINYVNRTV